MKKIVLLFIMILLTKAVAQESCGTKFLKIEEKLAKQYHEQLKDYKKYNLGICSKEDAHHEIVMLIPYIKKVEKYKNILSFLIAIVDNKHQIKESYLHKDAMKTSYISYLFKIDVQSYKSLLTNRPFAIIVEDVLDAPPTSSISKLFVYKRKQLRAILSNLIIEESDEEMADFSMQRKATLKSLQDSSSYQTLTFKDKFYYGVEPYAISPNVKNSKDFEWSVKLDDIICHYKNKKYTCMRKPVFNLDKIEVNTKKGWRYRKIVLLAMLHEEPLSEKNIKFYNNIAYNLREHKHQDESKFLSNILKRKFPKQIGEFFLSDIREKQKIVTKNLILQRVNNNRHLLAYDDILHQMIEKFKNKMEKKDYKALINEQKEWERGRELCNKFETKEHEVVDRCLLEQYTARVEYLNQKLDVGEALLPIYKKLIGYYRSDFIDLSKLDIKFNKSTVCNEDDKNYLRGLMMFYAYYYAFASFQNYDDFESTKIDTLNYGGYGFVKKLFDKIDEKQIQNYLHLAIDNLKESDKKSVFYLLKKLNKIYAVFKNHASPKLMKILKRQGQLHAEDIDMSLVKKQECLNEEFRASKIFINQSQIYYSDSTTFNDFAYTFWFRRYSDGTIEKIKKLIDDLLKEQNFLAKSDSKEYLKKLHFKLKDELKDKYIKEHKILSIDYFYKQFHQFYKQNIFNSTTTVTFTNKRNETQQCGNNQEEKIILGYSLIVPFYFIVENFFKNDLFWQSEDRKSLLSDYTLKKESLIAYVLNRVSIKRVESSLNKFLHLLTEKEINSLYDYAKALKNSYIKQNQHKDTKYNFYFSVKLATQEYPLPISSEPIYPQMNAFWKRRLLDNTEEKMYELLEFLLNTIETNFFNKESKK